MATPCVRVCVVEPASSLCIGCGRTLREIGSWASYSHATRAAIMSALPERLDRLKASAPDAFTD
ncbi:DUF1289 domain-containing protein [Xanthobacter dioxanivorans]|uniref:DUF1289 domain-containing protein n=1 Tax=Xanthobacter dioxanivorans TaxID=2528964 RepID=A0A974PTZ7_9HYPH|nr:DUF1289 domain-containing protein [Xanthobacter dioxanivorans]QRG09777.1 DUF1289 domain-containing protein [Xanthobacter dioxanivorans]